MLQSQWLQRQHFRRDSVVKWAFLVPPQRHFPDCVSSAWKMKAIPVTFDAFIHCICWVETTSNIDSGALEICVTSILLPGGAGTNDRRRTGRSPLGPRTSSLLCNSTFATSLPSAMAITSPTQRGPANSALRWKRHSTFSRS